MFRLRSRRNTFPQMPKHHSIVTWERDLVRASVIEMVDGAAELMGVAAAPVHGIGRTSHPDLDRWVAGCNKALTLAEDMTVASCGHKLVPDWVTMCVPAEIVEGLPVSVEYHRRSASRSISIEELRSVLDRGYRKAQDVIGSRSRKSSTDVVHGSVAEITVDGQPVMDPVGLHGETIQARITFCLVPLEWIRALELVCERLELRLAGIVPQHVVFAVPLIDPVALLIVLDEHHVTVSKARHGHIEWSTMVEIGEREIVGGSAQALNLEGRQSDALFRAYRAGELRQDIELLVARSFWVQLRAWMAAMAEQVQSFGPLASLPHHVYFLDLTRRIPEAMRSLETPFWEHSLPFDRCPEIIELDAGMVRDVLDCTAQAAGSSYLLLRGLAHYVAHAHASDHSLDRLLASVMRWR